jgi:hypothetical protein
MPKGSHKPDHFKPIKYPTTDLIEQLSSRTKIMRDKSHAQKLLSSRTNKVRGHAQKLCTNGTNLTESNNDKTLAKANGANAPLSRPIDIFRIEYQKAEKGEGETKTPNKDKATVIGKVFTQVFARAPDYGRLLKMAKDLNSGWELIKLMLNCGGCDIGDDPHDYVQKIISARKKGNGNGNQLGRTGNGKATATTGRPPGGDRLSVEELNRI